MAVTDSVKSGGYDSVSDIHVNCVCVLFRKCLRVPFLMSLGGTVHYGRQLGHSKLSDDVLPHLTTPLFTVGGSCLATTGACWRVRVVRGGWWKGLTGSGEGGTSDGVPLVVRVEVGW